MKTTSLFRSLPLILVCISLFSCAYSSDQKISFDQLPSESQSFVNTHFTNIKVKKVEKESDGYDVWLSGFQVDFELNGTWKKVDSETQKPIPQSILQLLPSGVVPYITNQYPDKNIVQIEIKTYGYKIELNGLRDLELMFDKEGDFMGKDH